MQTKELAVVYLASDGKRFITKEECDEHQKMLEYKKDLNNERRRKQVEEMGKLFTKVLEENNWGVYYMSKPINQLNVQDGNSPLFTVNRVDEETVRKAFLQEFERKIKQAEEQKWKQENTSQDDSETSSNLDTG